MTTLGEGTIKLVADARSFKAEMKEARKSIADLGKGQRDVSASASRSIQQHVEKLQLQAKMLGMSSREQEIFRLSARGATDAQLRLADAALRAKERHQQQDQAMRALRSSAVATAAAMGTLLVGGTIAAAVAIDRLINRAAGFQDLAEKMGDSAEAVASLAVAAAGGGTELNTISAASARLAKALTGVDDESVAAGAALKAIGINIAEFQRLRPVDQIEAVARALNEYKDSAAKSAAAQALFGRSGAELLPFMKELAQGSGRQIILTQEQIELADELKDRQAVLIAQIGLHAQAIAVEMMPSLNDLIGAFGDVLKGINGTSIAASELGRNNGIRDFADSAASALAFLIDAGDGVARVFTVAGKSIAGFVAVTDRLRRFDISGARAAAAAADEDIQATILRQTFGRSLEERRRQRQEEEQAAANFVGPLAPTGRSGRTLQFTGAVKKPSGSADNSAEQLARAQLDAQFAAIRRASDSSIAEFARAEQIMQAMRSAALIEDKEFYAAKAGFIDLNARAQAQAIEAEIALLRQQTFSGKNAATERLQNDERIADAVAKLAKVQADAVAARTVNSIEEAAANERVRQSYIDAGKAADAYLDSIRRRQQLELAALGRGNQFRDRAAGVADIEGRFIDREQQLRGELRRREITDRTFETYLAEAKRTYDAELTMYTQHTIAMEARSRDWTVGASEALINYYEDTRNIAKQVEEAWTNGLRGAEDALTSMLDKGRIDFTSLKDLAASVASDINRMFVREQITGPIAKRLSEGNLLGSIAGFFGGSSIGVAAQQAPAPVESRSIAAAISGGAGAAAGATDTAAFSASVAAAGTSFSAQTVAAGTSLSTATVTAGTSLSASIAASATAFSATITAAGAQFAASVAAAGAGSGSGGAGLIGSLGSRALDSFADGTPFVPRTGLYMLHQGERVVPAAQNARDGGGVTIVNNFNITGGQIDKRTMERIAKEMYLTGMSLVNRGISR